MFFRNVINEQSSAERSLLIQTIIAEIEKVALKKIESFYQDDSYNCALIDNLRRTKHNMGQSITNLQIEQCQLTR